MKEDEVVQAAKAHLASIVEFSSDAIVSIDLDGIVTSWNKTAERLFGYTRDEIVGRPVALLFPPDRSSEERDMFTRLNKGEIVPHYETERLRKDGTTVLVSIAVSPIQDSKGKILGASKIVHDITMQKRAEEELRALQAEMAHLSRWNIVGTMASSLAHELNQPLTAMLNYVHAARRLLGDAPAALRATEYLDKAVEETKLGLCAYEVVGAGQELPGRAGGATRHIAWPKGHAIRLMLRPTPSSFRGPKTRTTRFYQRSGV